MNKQKPTPKPAPPQALTLADVTITWQSADKTYSMNGRTVARLLVEAEAECPAGTWNGLFYEDIIVEELAGAAETCKLMTTGDLGAGYDTERILFALGNQLERLANRLKAGAMGDGDWQRKFRVEVAAPAAA